MFFCWILAAIFLCGFPGLATGENDSPLGASSLTLNQVSSGTVCQPDDPVDWWKVYISSASEIVVFLDGIGAVDVDLYFYDANLNLLAQSTGGGADEVVFGGVRGGWYYIKVVACFFSYACINYYLGVATSDACGYLSGYGDYDIYRVYLSAGNTYYVFLTDHSQTFDPDLFLFRDTTLIAESDSADNIDVIVYTPSVSGYYIIAVASAGGGGNYCLFVISR